MELDMQSMASYDMRSTASYYSANNSARTMIQANVKDNVKVIIRIRPFNEKEKSSAGGPKKCVNVENESTVVLDAKPDHKVFNFDFVGDEELEQKTIFDQIAKPIADCCLQGYNGSIFAYGQTGSGKTFTIQGPSVNVSGEEKVSTTLNKDRADYEKRGLMPRSFEYIFECIEDAKKKASEQNDHFEYLIRCTYLEIYNESIIDLLEPGSYNLHLREDIKKGVYVEGLLEENVQNEHEMMALITRGAKNRHMGSTAMNKESSRSHSVLTTIIETKSMSQSGVWNLKTSRFHIIDLAGSERAKHTNAIGERLKEAGMINKSLSALGNVINSLVDISEGKNRHVHYRDSKLTFLLRDSLGGNSKTVIIANISPSILNSGETLSTLKFAQRAKLIKNKAVINEDSSGTIQLLKTEIMRLKKDLAESEQRHQVISQQCQKCKNNVHSEFDNNDGADDEDLTIEGLSEDLELFNNSASNGAINETIKQKYVNSRQEAAKARKRVVYLESLLSSNLSTMSGQQKFYEQEISKSQLLVKKYQQSMETYEKQSSRDKMIIKFREDRIAKLEENQPQTIEDKHKLIHEFKKEIALLKEGADHNPLLAKLLTEKTEMQQQVNQLKKELNQTPDSLHAQIKSLSELNESLNEYLKQYCEGSKNEFESEISRLKQAQSQQAEEFNKSIDELLVKEQQYQEKFSQIQQQWTIDTKQQKLKIEAQSKKFQAEKLQMELTHKEQLDQLKVEIEQIHEGKNQEQTTAQMLKIEIAEKQNEYQTLSSQLNDQIIAQTTQIQQQNQQEQDLRDQIAHGATLVEEIKQQKQMEHNQLLQVIESEKKRNQASYKHAEEMWLKKLKQQEKEMLDAQNEKQIIDQQCSELDNRISSLISTQEELQQSLLFKDEALLELESSKKNLEELVSSLQTKLNEYRQQFESSKAQHLQQLEELNAGIQSLEEQKQQISDELQNSKSQYGAQLESTKKLQQQYQKLSEESQHNQQSLTQKNMEQQQQYEKLQQKTDNQTKEIEALEQQIAEANKQNLNNKAQYQQQLEQLLQSYNSQVEAKNEETSTLLKQKLEEKQALQVQLDELNKNMHELKQSSQSEISKLKEQAKQMISQYESQLSKQTESYKLEVESMIKAQTSKESCLLSDHVQQLKHLQKEHSMMQKEVEDQYKGEIQKLEALNKQHSEQNEAKHQSEILLLTNKLEQEEQDLIQDHEDQLNSLKAQNEDLLSQAQLSHSNEIQQLQNSNQKQLEELSIKLQQKVEGLEVHNNKLLSEQKENHEKQMDDLNSQYQQKIEVLIKQSEKKKFELEQLKMENLQTINLLKNQSNEEIDKSIKEKEQQKVQEISAINNKFNLQLAELNSQIKAWQEKLTQIQALHIKELESLNQNISQKEQKLLQNVSSRDENITSLNQQIAELQQEASLKADEHDKYINDKQHLINMLEDDLQVKEKHVQNLTQQVALLESKIKDLNKTVSQNEVDGNHQQLKITQLNEQVHAQNVQQTAQQSSNNHLQAELQKMTSNFQTLNEQYCKLEHSNQGVEQLLDQKQQEASQLRSNLREVQGQLNEQLLQNQKLNDNSEANLQNIQELQAQMTKLNTLLSSLTKQNEDLLEQQAQEKDIQEHTLAQKCKELSNLQEEVKQTEYDYQTHIQNIQQAHSDQIDSLQQDISLVKVELDQYQSSNSCLSKQHSQLQQTQKEQNVTIKQHKETIKAQSSKESSLIADIESKVNEYNAAQEKWRQSLQEQKDKRDQLKKEQEKVKKENENLRELVKLKDRQLEDLKGYDEMDRGNLDIIKRENKDLRNQVTKREFEMKEVVRTLKYYSEEKIRMEKELEKLHRENDQLIGHKNPSQKIQHHLKIKEENNKLREDNYKLLEELRKKEALIQKVMKSGGKDMAAAFQASKNQLDANESQNVEQVQKEFNGGIAKVIEHIIVQPGLIKILGLNEDNLERIQQQSSILKLKNIIDIISLLNNTLISKERDLKDVMTDKKRLEDQYCILEQEKNLINQQLEFKSSNHHASSSYDSNNIDRPVLNSQKAQTTRGNFREQKGDDMANIIANGIETKPSLLFQKQSSASKLQVFAQQPSERLASNASSTVGSSNSSSVIQQTKPPTLPLGCLKLIKEKENAMSQKKEAAASGGSSAGNRGGSSRRSAYLSNTNKQ